MMPLRLTLVLLLLPAISVAQGRGRPIGVSFVYSLDAGGPLSRIQTVEYSALRVEYRRALVAARGAEVDYVLGLVPLALVLRNPLGEVFPHQGGWALTRTLARTTTYGAGLSPFGLQLRLFPKGAVSPMVHAAGGLLLFSRPAPAANSNRLNLSGECGLGMQLRLGGKHGLGAGLAFQHFSNTGWGPVNPGLDSKLLYLRTELPF